MYIPEDLIILFILLIFIQKLNKDIFDFVVPKIAKFYKSSYKSLDARIINYFYKTSKNHKYNYFLFIFTIIVGLSLNEIFNFCYYGIIWLYKYKSNIIEIFLLANEIKLVIFMLFLIIFLLLFVVVIILTFRLLFIIYLPEYFKK